jgi:hypothetical protein
LNDHRGFLGSRVEQASTSVEHWFWYSSGIAVVQPPASVRPSPWPRKFEFLVEILKVA